MEDVATLPVMLAHALPCGGASLDVILPIPLSCPSCPFMPIPPVMLAHALPRGCALLDVTLLGQVQVSPTLVPASAFRLHGLNPA